MAMAPIKKGAGINPLSLTHYIDHLAVVCNIMDFPLLFTDESDFALGAKYYPELNAQLVDYNTLTPEYLISHYDVLFLSDLWDQETFHQKFGPLEKKYNKVLRHVHCPHGFSDKAFYILKSIEEDIILVYGQNMLDMFKNAGISELLKSYVITGNYRYTYFKKHKEFFDQIVQKEIFSRFKHPKQKTILYAPTWLDSDDSTTFFDATKFLLDHLPSHYNMIVKLHPRLELDDTVGYYQILGKYEDSSNIIFLKDFPLVFPILAHTDIYIGDTSSVGYDFLAFNKPMFFLNKNKREALLFKSGTQIYPEDYSNTYKIIDQTLKHEPPDFAKIRPALYQYTFGDERPFEAIKKDIINTYK